MSPSDLGEFALAHLTAGLGPQAQGIDPLPEEPMVDEPAPMADAGQA